MEEIPPLRAGLTVTADPSHPNLPFVLTDPSLGRRLRLDALGARLAEHLDVPQTIDTLAERLGVSAKQLMKPMAFFRDLHLLETPLAKQVLGEADATTKVHGESADQVPILLREEARFDCTMCGSCCGGHNVGPVMPDILEGLAPHTQMLEEATRTSKGLFFRVPAGGDAEEEHVLCQSRLGSCVFLADDRRCIIHARLGGDAKPRVCRLFPYQFIATPEGVAVSLQMECRGFPEARKGRPLREQEAEIRGLLAIAPTLARLKPVITVTGHTSVSYETYIATEEALHAAVDATPSDPFAALIAMRDICHRLDPRPLSVSSKGDLLSDLETSLTRLQKHAVGVLAEHVDPSADLRVHVDSLEVILDGVNGFGHDLHWALRPPAAAEVRALFREKAHHALMSKAWIKDGGLVQGFARFAFQWILSLACARERARQVKRHAIYAQDVMDALVVASFAWRTGEVSGLLSELDDALERVFYHGLEQLPALGESLRTRDPRVNFFKF